MITLRTAETDADFEAVRAVRMAVLPDERTATVEEIRATQTPERLMLVAELDGELAGSGVADRSSFVGRCFVAPRVLPHMRRRGVGTALLDALTAHARRLEAEEMVALVEGGDPGSLAFAERFGFEEVDRQVEQVKRLGDEPEPELPPGVELKTIAERPDLLAEAYELALEGYADLALPWPVTVTLEEWLREEATHPGGSFVALAGGEIVGYSGLMADADDATRAEDGLTVVRRDWRRRGLAVALKRAELAWAASTGIREVYTWTQRGNEGMRSANERLGYVYRHVSLTMRAPLRPE
jgi:GNAT superfamily N-acetyltransferase